MDSFLAIAEELKLKGLTGQTSNDKIEETENHANPKPVKTGELFEKSTAQNNFVKDEVVQNFHFFKTVSTALVNPNPSGDLETLDEKVRSMMEKSKNMVPDGKNANGKPKQKKAYICKVCGKEDRVSNIRTHIEANHLERISIPCDLCGKALGSIDALGSHKRRIHGAPV